MALNATNMGTEIKDAIKAGGYLLPDVDGGDEASVEALWQTIAEAIITHFSNNADISTTVAAGIVLTTPDTINGTTTAPGSGTGTIS